MVWHLQQAEMAYLKEDAMYEEIGDTIAISFHSEITHNGQNKQNIQNMNNPTNVNRNINPINNSTANNPNNYVSSRQPRFPGKCDHCQKWGHRRKICCFLKIIYSKMLKEPTYVCQYQGTYQETELKKK